MHICTQHKRDKGQDPAGITLRRISKTKLVLGKKTTDFNPDRALDQKLGVDEAKRIGALKS